MKVTLILYNNYYVNEILYPLFLNFYLKKKKN